MRNIIAVLATTVAMSLASSAYAEEEAQVKSKVEYKDDGGYESTRTSEHTTAAGTEHSSKTKVDVNVDSKGRVEKTVDAVSSTDPKGLMNKSKDISETDIVEKARGGYKQTTTRKHKDADGTNVTFKTTTDVDVDASGNLTTTAVTEKTVDPEGLMNETTSKTQTKSVNGQVVEKTKKGY